MAKHLLLNKAEKHFFNIFHSLCSTRDSWRVWSDFITASAISLSNPFELNAERKAEREKEYAECIKRLGGIEKSAELLKTVVMAFELNPNQDFLGNLFMKIGLNNHWRGQFFTPYHVCEMMAQITLSQADEEISTKGYVSVFDCACGAGAILIAAANVLRSNKINYQRNALFVAQDIDRTVGLMCYIQLSLLGCSGYVVIGDSITNPTIGEPLFPIEQSGQEWWYMPMFYTADWSFRRLCGAIRSDKNSHQ